MADRYAKLRAAQQSIGASSWQWWDSNSFRRLTFVEANGRHGQDGGALCAVVHPIDGHPDVQMASGVREFIEACSPDTIRVLLADYEEASAMALYESSVAEAAIEQVKKLEAERDKLRDLLTRIVGEVDDLIGESSGVYGLHLNGDPSPWGEVVAGGRFERLGVLEEARAALAQEGS